MDGQNIVPCSKKLYTCIFVCLASLPSTQNWLAPHIHGLLYRSPYANPTITQTSTCEQQKDAGRATQRSTWFGQSLVWFPTQVRVVRFYQSCSSPPPSSSFLLLLPPPSSSFLLLLLLRVLLLFYHLCLHFHVHCCLANSWPSSSPTSELSAHCWTSIWDLPSSVRTAGPQPETFLAQCAPLDLNLGPAELSAHH